MRRLAKFIRENRNRIVDEWLRHVDALPSARTLPTPALRDHVPLMLDVLADALDMEPPPERPLRTMAGEHAIERFREGYDVREVVHEYHALRDVVLVSCFGRGVLPSDSTPRIEVIFYIGRAMDDAVLEAVTHYVQAHDEARDRFVGMLGHDLRTPLQSTVIAAETILRNAEKLPERVVKHAARIKNNAARMGSMITDILDFARGRLGGGIPIDPRPADLRPVIAAVVDEIATAHPDRDLQCMASIAPGDLSGEWDVSRVQQIVSNLVDNAIKHGEDPIVVEPVDLGDAVRIDVMNEGAIPADVLPRLFQPFAPPTGHEPREGLGLGLDIVREIARAHGGSVSAHSTEADGTTVSVRLPKRTSATS